MPHVRRPPGFRAGGAKQLPIRSIDFTNPADIEKLDRMAAVHGLDWDWPVF